METRILIRADYWAGKDTLAMEQPYIVPEAMVILNQLLTADMRVLEFGCGGSTLFFARRCRSVLSFETKPDWEEKVKSHLSAKGIHNADVRLAATLSDCESVIGNDRFDLVYVDCDDIPRLPLAKRARDWATATGFVVLDNYDAMGMEHLDPSFFRGWSFTTLDDVHWYGRGTRIYSRVLRDRFIPINGSVWARTKRWTKSQLRRRFGRWIA